MPGVARRSLAFTAHEGISEAGKPAVGFIVALDFAAAYGVAGQVAVVADGLGAHTAGAVGQLFAAENAPTFEDFVFAARVEQGGTQLQAVFCTQQVLPAQDAAEAEGGKALGFEVAAGGGSAASGGLHFVLFVYRERLGGFSHKKQLNEVYGLSEEVITEVWKYFDLLTLAQITKLDLNQASKRELAKIPYLGYKEAEALLKIGRAHV